MKTGGTKRRPRKPADSGGLVISKIENVSKDLFSRYVSVIAKAVGSYPGIYALYDGDELYYVGRSADLKKRVQQHLKDRHLASWSHFSLYLVRDVQYINEIESLLIRIASPRGNRVVPQGKSSGPLLRLVMAMVREEQKKEREQLFSHNVSRRRVVSQSLPSAERSLKGLVSEKTTLFKNYKGKDFTASLLPDGSILLGRKKFTSPSAAAKAITKGSSRNGWKFWYIKDLKGQWVRLADYKD